MIACDCVREKVKKLVSFAFERTQGREALISERAKTL